MAVSLKSRPRLYFSSDATVDAHGRMKIRDVDALHGWARRVHAGADLVLTVQEAEDVRSLRANAYYWGVVLALAAEHTGHEATDLHEFFKAQFLEREMLLQLGGIERVVRTSTAKLSREKFREYVELVRLFLSEKLHVETPDPDPTWWAKKGASDDRDRDYGSAC